MAGLYLHIPFCQKKCAYCDFFSVEGEENLIPQFIDSLCREIVLRSIPKSNKPTVETIYIGGGTPSLLLPEQVSHLLQCIRSHFSIAAEPEITMESNPWSLSAETLHGYLEAGVNRISMGIQSFQNQELNLLGRLHSSDLAEEVLVLSQKTGFHHIGIDLISGLPLQTLEAHEANLKRAVTLRPDHISIYTLTWSRQTELGRKIESGELPQPNEKTVRDMLLMTHDLLTEAGYEHYEISNYAQPGGRCRHNEGYWTGEEYLGFGPSAHSYQNNQRFWNCSNIKKYITVLSQNRLPVQGKEVLEPQQQKMEHIFLGLRRKEGIPIHLIEDTSGIIQMMVKEGLAKISKNAFTLTPKGLCVADEIALRLLNEEASTR